jgi:hypothetical protein
LVANCVTNAASANPTNPINPPVCFCVYTHLVGWFVGLVWAGSTMYQPNQPNLLTHETCIYTNIFLESIIYRLRNTLNGNRPSWSFDPGPAQPPSIYTNNGGLIGVAWVGSSDVGTQPEPTQLAVFTCVYKLSDGCAVVVLVVLCWLGLGRFKQGADPPMGFGASPSPPNRGRGRGRVPNCRRVPSSGQSISVACSADSRRKVELAP